MSPTERCESSVGLAWWKCNLKSWWKNLKKKMPLCEVTQRHPTQTISVKTWKSPECKQGFSCKSSDMPLRDIASDWTPLFSVELTSTLGWTHKHIKKSRYKLTQDRFGIQWNKRCMNRTKCFAQRLIKSVQKAGSSYLTEQMLSVNMYSRENDDCISVYFVETRVQCQNMRRCNCLVSNLVVNVSHLTHVSQSQLCNQFH